MKRLDHIAEYCKNATQGPWQMWAGQGWPLGWEEILGISRDECGTAFPIRTKDQNQNDVPFILCGNSQDQVFVSRAREDLPWLLERVKKLEATVRSLLEECEPCYNEETCGSCKLIRICHEALDDDK